jgi:hypothetical protein
VDRLECRHGLYCEKALPCAEFIALMAAWVNIYARFALLRASPAGRKEGALCCVLRHG